MPWISIPQFAEDNDVTKVYIYTLLKRGKISKDATKPKFRGSKQLLIDSKKALEYMKGNIRSQEKNKPKSKIKKLIKLKQIGSESIDDEKKVIEKAGLQTFNNLTEAQKHKETYLAALKKLEYEQKCGELIPAEQVKRDAERAARIVKEKVTSWPGRVAALVAVEPDPFKCDQILRQECNQLLDEIAKEVLR